MKKLLSFPALYALLYAMPMNANYFVGYLFQRQFYLSRVFQNHMDTIGMLAAPILLMILMLLIHTLLLRYSLKDTSITQAFLAACIGNIPSTIVGIIDRADFGSGQLFSWAGLRCMDLFRATNLPLSHTTVICMILSTSLIALLSSLLMIITLTIIFRYPVKKLIMPAVLGNIIVGFIFIAFMLFMAGGFCCL